ncbi:DUF5610 domain-containing protein [Candidatus Sumerlaeota bacterium]|nr:DUF5610 domain-containing protein [Candidatus Sumerlaeota bacterium]
MAVGAERSESRESVAVLAPGEETPEALAGRIVEGIAEFIMGSWRSRHPDMEEADVLRFQNQVMRGFELGLNDTKDILTGLGVFTPVVADSLERTEGLAREQLAEVFETTLKSVRGSRPADLPSPL